MSVQIATILAVLGTGFVLGQCASKADSPKEVIEQFVGMEVQGERLTPQGWQRASVFFVRPDPVSAYPRIFVIGENFTTWDPVFDPTQMKARIDVEIVPKGDIDSKARFGPMGRTFQKNNAVFHLRYEGRRPVTGKLESLDAPRWRIAGPNDVVMLSLSAAIRYAGRVADSAKDPVIRKNAAETLTKLESLE